MEKELLIENEIIEQEIDIKEDVIQINSANQNVDLNTLINIFYPIGSYYETSETTFDPNISWGGTWELETDGTVLVSKSNVADSKFNNVLGTVLGEESVQLQFTDYQHFLYNCYVGNPDNDIVRYVDFTGGGYGFGAQYDGNKNTPHNNIQPSKIVNRWHRTA